MAVPKEPIADAEMEVLKVLWTAGSLSARELTEAIYRDPNPSNIGTVQKLLQRLERKGCVKRDRSQYVHRFTARLTQSQVAGRQLELLAKKVADGSLVPFITHLVEAGRLTERDKAEIRKLLEE